MPFGPRGVRTIGRWECGALRSPLLLLPPKRVLLCSGKGFSLDLLLQLLPLLRPNGRHRHSRIRGGS